MADRGSGRRERLIQSEANVLNSNVLPGAEGEAAHQDALGQSIGQILRGDPVDPDIAAASQTVMARAQREQGFTLPKFDAAEVSRLSEEAELHERSGALTDQLASLPSGDQGAAETLARLQQVERELSEATTPEARRALSDRRDELLTDTNPETLQAAAAPIEQRRAATSEQAAIDARLQEIDNERGQAQLDQASSGEQAPQPTFAARAALSGTDAVRRPHRAHRRAHGHARGRDCGRRGLSRNALPH